MYRLFASHHFKLIKSDSQAELKLSNGSKDSKFSAVSSVNNKFKTLSYPLTISGLIIALLLCWYCKIEFYPFTAMQMFSNKQTSGYVKYNKVIAHYDSKISSRVYPEKIIPALYDTRYRSAIMGCFSENYRRLQVCNSLLQNIGYIHNKTAQNGEKIEKIEIQLWVWNFLKGVSDPNHGRLAKNHLVQINQ